MASSRTEGVETTRGVATLKGTKACSGLSCMQDALSSCVRQTEKQFDKGICQTSALSCKPASCQSQSQLSLALGCSLGHPMRDQVLVWYSRQRRPRSAFFGRWLYEELLCPARLSKSCLAVRPLLLNGGP